MRRLLLAIALVGLPLALPAAAQIVRGVDIGAVGAESRGAVPGALQVFAGLVDAQNAQAAGFADQGAVLRAQPDVPLVDFAVGIKELAAYRGGDPLAIARPTNSVVYPLASTGGRLSSITLSRRDARWLPVSFGSPARTKLVVATRSEVARRGEVALNACFQLRVPTYNLLFVAHLRGNDLQLTPVIDYPEFNLTRNRTTDARSVFTRLVDAARRDAGGLR
jgi:hypothetical protein